MDFLIYYKKHESMSHYTETNITHFLEELNTFENVQSTVYTSNTLTLK